MILRICLRTLYIIPGQPGTSRVTDALKNGFGIVSLLEY
jgi:hypothetical protein